MNEWVNSHAQFAFSHLIQFMTPGQGIVPSTVFPSSSEIIQMILQSLVHKSHDRDNPTLVLSSPRIPVFIKLTIKTLHHSTPYILITGNLKLKFQRNCSHPSLNVLKGFEKMNGIIFMLVSFGINIIVVPKCFSL